MSRISQKWAELRRRGEKAFIPFITCGYPSLEETYDLVLKLEEKGADIIELGIPFSDPVAEGPVIQASSQVALENGVNLPKIWELVKEVRKKSQIPLVTMSYYNPIFRWGIDRFVKEGVKAGVDGVIAADLAPEEGGELRREARQKGLDTIFLVAPTSFSERIESIIEACTGFVYCVSLTGVTGVRKELASLLQKRVEDLKKMTVKPVAVGFGVSNAEQAGHVASFADGVIIGSALIKLIQENLSREDMLNKIGKFAEDLSEAIHSIGNDAN